VELFLRDRATIFSPIVQTRILQAEYIREMGGNPVPVNSPSPMPMRSPSRMRPIAENAIDRVAVDAALTTPITNGQSSGSLDMSHNKDEIADNISNGSERFLFVLFLPIVFPDDVSATSEGGDDYTLVGITSVQKPRNQDSQIG
jgi:hypothetical protein